MRLMTGLLNRLFLNSWSSSSSSISSSTSNWLSIGIRSGHTFPQWANLPPHYPINGTGSVYDTKISRKRQVTDPSVPSFERQTTLKWQDWRMLRDLRRRYIFSRFFPTRTILYTIRKSKLMPSNIRESAFEQECCLPRDSNIKHLNNRCIISSRSRGNLKQYKITRHQWRLLADYNKLSGVGKASWG
ncbi:28S ribosomal protein S14, mitochondrial-like [Oppia nitens]|uniref:28S ribosomal protein S14, mitochondrial-like n=1 Tax=Oppia nitens TaxID=1686743 RepID=UPI0023DB1154|nr:28S ribosomal protein S14, mitochondrial-like [Oppia nitens]